METAIIQYLQRDYNLIIGERTAERIEEELRHAAGSGTDRELTVKGRDTVSGIPKTRTVTVKELRSALGNLRE